MADFDDLATSLIADLTPTFSKSITYKQTVKGGYNPLTGSTSADTVTSHTVRADIIQADKREIDGINVQVGDKKVIVYYTNEATTDDEVTIDTLNYQVVAVTAQHYAVDSFQSQEIYIRRTV